MKRPQRNLSIVITAIALGYLVLIRLPLPYALGAVATLLAFAVVLIFRGSRLHGRTLLLEPP